MADLNYALFDDLNIPTRKTLTQCCVCGMMFDDTSLTEQHLNHYYANSKHYEFVYSGKLGDWRIEGEDRLDRIIHQFLPLLPPAPKVLDFGCACGVLLQRCRELGISDVAGVELGENSRASARQAGLVVEASLSGLAGFCPDVIVCTQVLEHLLSPRDTLRTMAEFAPGALVYLEVPAADHLLLKCPVEWWTYFFEHINHFTGESLRALCSACEIEVITDGVAPYSSEVPAECRWLMGRMPKSPKSRFRPQRPSYLHPRLPRVGESTLETIADVKGPLAMWGISQYAMLLLGSCPDLAARVKRLFDTSPTKVGRSVAGMTVEHSQHIGTLTPAYVLLIPKSNYLKKMLDLLPEMGFDGLALEV